MISPSSTLLSTTPLQQSRNLAGAASWQKQTSNLLFGPFQSIQSTGNFLDGQYYFDKVLPFGLRSAPYILNQLSDGDKCFISFACHVFDDFLIVKPPCSTPPLDSLCRASLSSMILTFKLLNIPISAAKTESPSTIIQFMGIILHSGKMEARLPEDKVGRIKLCSLDQTRPHPSPFVQSLTKEIEHYLGMALAQSTKKTQFGCATIPQFLFSNDH